MERGKIIVVANQKGGVAKTSTVRNLSYALAEMGKKVLVVDFDPQYNLTTSFGVLPTQTPCNTGTLITNLLLDESLPDTNEFIQKIGSVDLIPSSRSLTVAEANLLMTPDSNDYLAALLNPLRLSYDYIIVDTNPSLGSLTINALTAADEVIIPIDPELFALTGLQALVDTIKKIKRKLNPSIEIGGILFTKCNKRTNLYLDLCDDEHSHLQEKFLREYVKQFGFTADTVPVFVRGVLSMQNMKYSKDYAAWMANAESLDALLEAKIHLSEIVPSGFSSDEDDDDDEGEEPAEETEASPEEVLQYAWETVCYVIWGKASAKGGQKVVEAAPEELRERYQEIFQ